MEVLRCALALACQGPAWRSSTVRFTSIRRAEDRQPKGQRHPHRQRLPPGGAPEAFAVSGREHFELDDDHGDGPACPNLAQQGSEEPVTGSQTRPFH